MPELSNWSASKSLEGDFFLETYQTLSPSQNFSTGQPAMFVGCFFVESLPKLVAMPELSNRSASKACGGVFCGNLIKTCRHARTFQLVSHARTFPLVSQQTLVGVFFLWKAYHNLSPCPKFPTGQPCCQNFPTGQPAKLVEVFFCGKFTKTCRHGRTFQLVTFQLVSQQCLWGCFFVESFPKPVDMPELSNWSAMLSELSKW